MPTSRDNIRLADWGGRPVFWPQGRPNWQTRRRRRRGLLSASVTARL